MLKKLLYFACISFLLPASFACAQPVGQLPAASTATGYQVPCAPVGGTNGTTKGCTPAQIVTAGGGGGGGTGTVNGSMYFNTPSSVFRIYEGGAWKSL